MVRNYKVKGKRCQYSQENVEKAVADIRNKTLTIRAASRAYGIPRTTLQDAITERASRRRGQIGRRPCLGEEFERQLLNYAIQMKSSVLWHNQEPTL